MPFAVTIYRDSWMRGTKAGCLFDSQTKTMCCLGQVAYQAGIKLDDLEGHSNLSFVSVDNYSFTYPDTINHLLEDIGYLRIADSFIATRAMANNDARDIDDTERELRVTKNLADADIVATFVDGIAPWFLESAQ